MRSTHLRCYDALDTRTSSAAMLILVIEVGQSAPLDRPLS